MEERKGITMFFLLKRVWTHSKGNRVTVATYWLMLVISELINTFWLPLVMAQFIDVATRDGVNPKTAGKLAMLLSFLVLRSIASWIFHGPARINEKLS